MNNIDIGEVYFEFRQVGNVVKVTALHAASGTEACVVGPPAAGEQGLKLAAMRKLVFVLGQSKGPEAPAAPVRDGLGPHERLA